MGLGAAAAARERKKKKQDTHYCRHCPPVTSVASAVSHCEMSGAPKIEKNNSPATPSHDQTKKEMPTSQLFKKDSNSKPCPKHEAECRISQTPAPKTQNSSGGPDADAFRVASAGESSAQHLQGKIWGIRGFNSL